MALSYRNILNGNQILDILNSGNFTKDALNKSIKKKQTNAAKYIKGYAQDSAIESLANSLNINKGLFKQMFGLEDKKMDAYDPYHLSDSKPEEFWYLRRIQDEEGRTNGLRSPQSGNYDKSDGKSIQKKYDDDTNTFKRSLNSEFGFRRQDFWYEDPFIPSFEIFIDDDSTFFKGSQFENDTDASKNSFKYFIQNYSTIDPIDYNMRFNLWVEFKNVLFKIFERDLKQNSNRNEHNKAYYITKLTGLNNLNKKITTYGEDKISITLNEDIAMFAWYLSELYNNIVYNYRNQRFAIPENLLRFNMTIQINDIRNFQIPKSGNISSDRVPVDRNSIENKFVENRISPKSKIVYTLHDCNFNFFESRNYGDDIEIGGYGSPSFSPQSLTFDIYYKSVTRYSEFPLISSSLQTDKQKSTKISPWEKDIVTEGSKQAYYEDLDRIRYDSPPEKKGYLNKLLGKAAQTVANIGLDYLDSLETKLREVRGGAVNSLLEQFRNVTKINKIEPDNVYAPNFNSRTNVRNLARRVGSELQNEFEDAVRNAANF
jgi:hypothetical protein